MTSARWLARGMFTTVDCACAVLTEAPTAPARTMRANSFLVIWVPPSRIRWLAVQELDLSTEQVFRRAEFPRVSVQSRISRGDRRGSVRTLDSPVPKKESAFQLRVHGNSCVQKLRNRAAFLGILCRFVKFRFV